MNRIESYDFGIRYSDELSFPMEVYNKHGMHYEMYEVQAIQEWLFGRKEAKYLSILDPDKGSFSYLCRLVNPKIVKVDNKVIGWKFDVTCSNCYSSTDIIEKSYECLNEVTNIDYCNMSNIEDYLYPEMSIQTLGTSTYINISNLNDNNRSFQITNIKPNTSIYVDNSHKIITADNGDDVFQNFNLNWFRFNIGYNRLVVNGVCIITFRNRFMSAVGGY